MAAATLYALLPSGLEVGYWQFLSVFLLASVAVVLSHVPGGIGVFELVIVGLLGAQNSSELVASLLAFRVLYYFVPLVVASSCFGFFELRQVRETVQPALRQTESSVWSDCAELDCWSRVYWWQRTVVLGCNT